ncbi:MAG: penicillin acylase family protein [Terriglobales bacterium]
MPATTVPAPARRTRRLVLRAALALVVVAVVAGASFATWFYWAARASLPQVAGRLAVAGLTAPVTVVRDAQGVPHIVAANLDDLFFAQGFVTAQDRLWQMDMVRRYAAGEMSEVLGSGFLKHDRRQRTLLTRVAAENAAAHLSPRDRGHFEAYARGVNACITSQEHLPIEFRVLRYRPRPWTVTDSFLVAINMVQMLNLETLGHELAREKITARLAPELAADLYPNSSWRDHPPVSAPGQDEFMPADEKQRQPEEPQPERRRRRRPLQVTELRTDNWQLTTSDELVPGSNNWVVSGAHTVSGKPLLANDMHLGHQIPNVWYEAHLSSGAFDVAGVTLPGLPYVIVGHNQRIAWGFTNVGPNTADLFIETFNERGEYLTPDGRQQPERRQEIIRVRRNMLSTATRDVPLTVIVTRHGPIVTAIQPGETRPLALKWALHDPATMQVPFFDMNMAQNWTEFRAALARFTAPAQNVVYADMDGHIGYQLAGMIPMRASGDGALPVSGSDNAHEWTGYIPFDKLPSVFDPPSGILATANGRVTPDGYPYSISTEWGSPYRTERIYRVLGSGKKLAAAGMLALQADIYSEFDRFCAQRFTYAVDHAARPSARAKEAAELMRTWDGQITAGSSAAVIVAKTRRQLTRLLLGPHLGPGSEDPLHPGGWQVYRWFMSSAWLENVLLHRPQRWLPSNYATWEDLIAAAVDAAVTQPDVPRDLRQWRWGKEIPLNLQHPLFGDIPMLGRWTGTGRWEQSGSGFTVKQVSSRIGPSQRMTVDFSNFDASTLNIVNGQSGQVFSRHYMDQWKAWYEGTTFPLPFSAGAVQKAKVQELVLEPK